MTSRKDQKQNRHLIHLNSHHMTGQEEEEEGEEKEEERRGEEKEEERRGEEKEEGMWCTSFVFIRRFGAVPHDSPKKEKGAKS